LYREPFPTVGLDGHDKRCGDKHGDYPWCHADVPMVDNFAQGNLMENIGEPAYTDEKLDDTLGEIFVVCAVLDH